jgi:hypothetical protein
MKNVDSYRSRDIALYGKTTHEQVGKRDTQLSLYSSRNDRNYFIEQSSNTNIGHGENSSQNIHGMEMVREAAERRVQQYTRTRRKQLLCWLLRNDIRFVGMNSSLHSMSHRTTSGQRNNMKVATVEPTQERSESRLWKTLH